MHREIITTDRIAPSVGPFSAAVLAGDLLFLSGQIALDPSTGQLVPGGIAEQTRRVLENLSAILKAEHLGFDHVVKTTIFLTSMDDFQTVNEIYGSYFRENPPARSTVAVAGLPKGAKVEIEMIAMAQERGGSSASAIVGDTSG